MFLVLALTGSALAVTQQRIYQEEQAEASDVTAVQQHSIFVEIVVEDKDDEEQIHKFAAVVGLIKKCKQVRHVFDNAVLWFNDQFLFGDKDRDVRNETPDSALGVNPEDNDLMTPDGDIGRWGGCYTPDGFAFAIGTDDPYGIGAPLEQDAYANETTRQTCEQTEPYRAQADSSRKEHTNNTLTNATQRDSPRCEPIDDNMDLVKRLIDLDNACRGCIFEYQSSFFITDPNDPFTSQSVRWIVDKLVYPVSVLGNVFQEGEDAALNGGSCASGDGIVPVSDPRDNYPHHDTCRDDVPQNNHRCQGDEADCRPPQDAVSPDDGETADNALVEPLFAVHLQVDPLSPTGMGYIDQAPWEYKDGSQTDGMPISQYEHEEAFDDCKTDRFQAFECAIEYNFLLAVDFAAFDRDEVQNGSVQHGEGQLPQPRAHEGNSHPHNPQTLDAGPDHVHDTVTLDVFFHERAPFFIMDMPYWDDSGQPPAANEDCSGVADEDSVSSQRAEAVERRSPIVCDTDDDAGQFHRHDGSQTIREG